MGPLIIGTPYHEDTISQGHLIIEASYGWDTLSWRGLFHWDSFSLGHLITGHLITGSLIIGEVL
jgi:hypothetical protein